MVSHEAAAYIVAMGVRPASYSGNDGFAASRVISFGANPNMSGNTQYVGDYFWNDVGLQRSN
jgi:hypothetical protein